MYLLTYKNKSKLHHLGFFFCNSTYYLPTIKLFVHQILEVMHYVV